MLGNLRISAPLVRMRAAERLMRHKFLQDLLLLLPLGSGVDYSLLLNSDTASYSDHLCGV